MDEIGLRRRDVLSGLAVVGSAGALVGQGTAALFSDEESTQVAFTAGSVDLIVETDEGTSEGSVSVPIDLTDADDDGIYRDRTTLTASLKDGGNPAYAWLGASCPQSSSAGSQSLWTDLEVSISYADGGTLADWQPLVDLAEDGGIPLDPAGDGSPDEQRCLQPSDDLDLEIDWRLDGGGDYQSTEVEFVFVGQQCRHNDDPSNPIASRDCEICECCVRLGKLELDEDVDGTLEEGTTYEFSEGTTDYGIRIVGTETKDGGQEDIAAEFEVVGLDGTPDPELCRAELDGGPNTGDDSGIERYDLPGTSNDTGQLLYAPSRDGDSYYAISSITVSLCRDTNGSDCPDDKVRPRGES